MYKKRNINDNNNNTNDRGSLKIVIILSFILVMISYSTHSKVKIFFFQNCMARLLIPSPGLIQFHIHILFIAHDLRKKSKH